MRTQLIGLICFLAIIFDSTFVFAASSKKKEENKLDSLIVKTKLKLPKDLISLLTVPHNFSANSEHDEGGKIMTYHDKNNGINIIIPIAKKVTINLRSANESKDDKEKSNKRKINNKEDNISPESKHSNLVHSKCNDHDDDDDDDDDDDEDNDHYNENHNYSEDDDDDDDDDEKEVVEEVIETNDDDEDNDQNEDDNEDDNDNDDDEEVDEDSDTDENNDNEIEEDVDEDDEEDDGEDNEEDDEEDDEDNDADDENDDEFRNKEYANKKSDSVVEKSKVKHHKQANIPKNLQTKKTKMTPFNTVSRNNNLSHQNPTSGESKNISPDEQSRSYPYSTYSYPYSYSYPIPMYYYYPNESQQS